MPVETVERPAAEQNAAPVAPQQPTQSRLPGGKILLAALALPLVIAAALFFVLKDDGGSSAGEAGTVSGSKEDAFRMSYPKNWNPLAKDDLSSLPGKPLAVLRRNDGKGFVVVRREQGRPPAKVEALSADLGKELRKRVPDFKERSTKQVKIRGGSAVFTSYIRKRTGTVHSIVIVPAGNKTFTLNTVSRGGANDVAREIGRMILSFDV